MVVIFEIIATIDILSGVLMIAQATDVVIALSAIGGGLLLLVLALILGELKKINEKMK